MVVILTTLAFGHSTYTEVAALNNLADTMALDIREAQVYGIAVKELDTGSSNFSTPYGVSFSLLGSGSNAAYIIFADRDSDHAYDGTWACDTGGSAECLRRVDLTQGIYIDSLCNIKPNNIVSCDFVRRADVTFVRPNAEATITFFLSDGTSYNPANPIGEQITLKSPSGLTKKVKVYFSGQVSVQ